MGLLGIQPALETVRAHKHWQSPGLQLSHRLRAVYYSSEGFGSSASGIAEQPQSLPSLSSLTCGMGLAVTLAWQAVRVGWTTASGEPLGAVHRVARPLLSAALRPPLATPKPSAACSRAALPLGSMPSTPVQVACPVSEGPA